MDSQGVEDDDFTIRNGCPVDEDSCLPLVYDVEAINRFWSERPGEVLGRAVHVIAVLGPYLAKVALWEYLIRRKIRDHKGLQRK